MSVRQRKRPNAVRRERALQAVTCQSCWKKRSARNLLSSPAIKAAVRSISPLSAANFTVGLSLFKPITRVNLTIRGVKKVSRILMQTGQSRDPRLADVPTLRELMDEHKTAEADRRLAPMVLAATDFGRPIIAPPGTPTDRLRVL